MASARGLIRKQSAVSVSACGDALSLRESAVDFTERTGNNSKSVLEQLFDKLFKKALAHVSNNKKIVHDDNLKSVERRSGFPWASITSGRT